MSTVGFRSIVDVVGFMPMSENSSLIVNIGGFMIISENSWVNSWKSSENSCLMTNIGGFMTMSENSRKIYVKVP